MQTVLTLGDFNTGSRLYAIELVAWEVLTVSKQFGMWHVFLRIVKQFLYAIKIDWNILNIWTNY